MFFFYDYVYGSMVFILIVLYRTGTYERAQVVRLDSRWVRMLRYHLGTSFEDVWIPASGETDAHLGNTL